MQLHRMITRWRRLYSQRGWSSQGQWSRLRRQRRWLRLCSQWQWLRLYSQRGWSSQRQWSRLRSQHRWLRKCSQRGWSSRWQWSRLRSQRRWHRLCSQRRWCRLANQRQWAWILWEVDWFKCQMDNCSCCHRIPIQWLNRWYCRLYRLYNPLVQIIKPSQHLRCNHRLCHLWNKQSQ